MIIVSVLIWLVEQYAINPSAYSLNSFSTETIHKVEKEFLFTLPEKAHIDYVSYTTGLGRGNQARCYIVGTFTADEFMNEYVQFDIGSNFNNEPNIYKISGFPKFQKDVDYLLEFTENGGQTTAIIQKGGIQDKSLFKGMAQIH